jgi:protein-disulfide isomerase
MKIRELFSNAVTVLAVACALATTVGAYRRGTLFSRGEDGRVAELPSKPVAEWAELLKSGRLIGPADAPVTIVEFGDFECPACASFARKMDTVRLRHPKDFAVVFHHFPLPYHRLAYPLARGAECAAGQSKFAQFHDAVYAHRDSLGVLSLSQLGRLARVPDQAAFGKCVADTSRVASIERDVVTARRIGARGTPTIIVDGVMRGGQPPSVQELEEHIAKRTRSLANKERTGPLSAKP